MRSPLIPSLALLLVVAPAVARADEPVDLDVVNRIRHEGLHNSEVMEILEHLTDVIGPRLTGSPRLKEANEWTRDRLAGWGLESARLDPFEFGRGWSFSHASVHMIAPRETPLSALPAAWTPGTDGPVRGEVMRATLDSEDDFEPLRGRLRGKILFLEESSTRESEDEPESPRFSADELEELRNFDIPSGRFQQFRKRFAKRWALRRKLNDFLVEEGLVATVSASSFGNGIVRVGGGGSYHADESPGVPSLVMAVEHYNWILRLVGEPKPAAPSPAPASASDEAGEAPEPPAGTESEDGKPPVVLEIDVRARFHDDDPNAYNTVAEIPGTDPRAGVVMLGGHLDSWHAGTGAVDNGAGCAVMMEAVRILQALGVRPKRTIRIALWAGEEQGLIGSRHYVDENFASRPLPEDPEERRKPSFLWTDPGPLTVKPDHARLSAYFNLDNGSGKIRGIYAQENVAVVPIFEAWLRPFHDLGAGTVTTNSTRGTDHLSFDSVGLPGFQFVQDQLDYGTHAHHSVLDTLDHASKEDLMQAAVIVASFVYHTAMRDQPLPRKPMPRDG